MRTISLNGIWKLTGRPQMEPQTQCLSLSAEVPGCVQLDLSREGHLPEDLFYGENILQAEAFEGWEWWYERTFQAPEERENVFLVFEGVDCIAEYFLNDVKIGESANMLIAHEFEVGAYLRDGENTLTVHLKSPVIAAHEREYSVHAMMTWGNAPMETGVRRAPHSYGWDIMPRAVTSGLWRDVKLEIRDRIRFSQLFFRTWETGCDILFEVECPWTEAGNLEIEAEGGCGADSTFYLRKKLTKGKAGRFELPIANPKSWWPYGYGEANLYDACVRLYSHGQLVHEETARFGLRSVELDRTDTTDGINGQFRVLINGTEIMCKGSNWVPLDAFHCRDAGRLDQAMALVKDVGCNILRCWGGNVYEDHAFFDFCDENGIMIWQDFSMACRIYPEDEAFKAQLREEVAAVVKKLRNHPSLILWAGDNEVDELLSGYTRPSVNSLTRQVIPEQVAIHDVGRPYLPSSPYITDAVWESNGLVPPERHVWGPRDYYKSGFYKEDKAHFISEIGYHGCPDLESIRQFITPEQVWPYQDNPEWILHSSDQNGNSGRVLLMEKQVRQLFGRVPTEPEDYILASQISQAEAKKYFIERMRVGRPRKTGVIWWNLLDGWPQMSDAVVDYYFRKKVAYRYIKRAQAPFSIAADEISHWNMRFYACNDTLEEKKGDFVVLDGQTGETLLEGEFTAAANGSTCIGKLPVFYSEQNILILKWTVGEETGFNHYLCGYPPFSLEQYRTLMEKWGL